MKIIFDKGTETQRAVEITHFGESLGRGVLNAVWTGRLGEVASVPAVKQLVDAPAFVTVEVVDGEGDGSFAVPVQGDYNVIRDANVNYAASERLYTMTLVLGRDQAK
jgi:hypothetical protein